MEMHIYLIQLIASFVKSLRSQIEKKEAEITHLNDCKHKKGLDQITAMRMDLRLMEGVLQSISTKIGKTGCEDYVRRTVLWGTGVTGRAILKRLFLFAKQNRVFNLNPNPEFETPQCADCYRKLAAAAAEALI